MDFFQKHDKALRKGRLLQSAATLFVYFRSIGLEYAESSAMAVERAFMLEEKIETRLEQEKS